MSKIAVVKMFAFPKLVYPLTALNNIRNEKYKEIENLICLSLFGIKNHTK